LLSSDLQLEQRIQFAIHGDVEMRDRLLGFLQAAGDGLAHAVVLDQLVGAFGEVLEHGVVDMPLPVRRLARPQRLRRLPSRCLAGARGDGRLDVLLDDAAMRPGAGDLRHVDTGILGDAARQRRGENALSPPWWSAPAFTVRRDSVAAACRGLRLGRTPAPVFRLPCFRRFCLLGLPGAGRITATLGRIIGLRLRRRGWRSRH
jgi:hypothetical protein